MAVREPYVEPPKDQMLAEKFNQIFVDATADPTGWGGVSGKSDMDKKQDARKPMSLSDAAAQLDAVLPRNGGEKPKVAEKAQVRFAPPTRDEDLVDDSDVTEGLAELARHADDGDLEEVVEDVSGDASDDDETEAEPEPDEAADEPVVAPPEKSEKQRPAERPAERPRRTAGRGLRGKRSQGQDKKVVASVNPMEEEAISTAAAELAPHPGQDGGAERLDEDDRRAIDDFTAVARSPATLATYREDLRQFSDWCAQKGIRSFPAEPRVVAAWASFMAKKKRLKLQQIERKISAISAAHVALQHTSPCQDSTVRNVMIGIKSALESDQNSTAPITPNDLRAIMTDAPRTMRWRRNKAMLLLGFSAALRQAELVEVRIEGLRFDADGLFMAIPGRIASAVETVKIPKVPGRLCTVGAVAKWITAAGITSGYLFRNVHDGGVVDEDPDRHVPAARVNKIVKDAVKVIGLDPRRYNARSLRIGYGDAVREAAQKTIRDIDYVRQTITPQTL